MAEPKVLLVYYSLSGNTRRLAREIETATQSDVDEIVDGRKRTGRIGGFIAGLEAWSGWPVAIHDSRFDPGAYDLVVVGTPIWKSCVSSPVRAYLKRHRGHLPEVAFFMTTGHTGIEQVTSQLEKLAGRAPRAVLALREVDLVDMHARAQAFAAEIRRALATRSAA